MDTRDHGADRSYYVGKPDYKQGVRLLLLHPFTAGSPEAVDPERALALPSQPYLRSGTQVDQLYCLGAPAAIENEADCRLATPIVVEKARWAAARGYDAVVVNCMLDPGVEEAKRAVEIPVIGLREATLAISTLLGSRPANIYPGGIPVLELATDEEETFERTAAAGEQQIRNRGADVLIPNCSYLQGLAPRLQAALGVPVLASRDMGLVMAEMLATFGVRPGTERARAKMPSEWSRFVFRARHRIKRELARFRRPR